MLDIKTALNSAGLALTVVGVYVVYRYSPLNFHSIDGGGADTDFTAVQREADRRNALVKVGVYVVIIGTVVQLISNFIPSNQ